MKEEYRAIKNFIHNEMQVNRSVIDHIIREYIDMRITQIVREAISTFDTHRVIAGIIASEINLAKKEPEKRDSLYYFMGKGRSDIRGFIKDTVRVQVKELVEKSLNVEVNFQKPTPHEKEEM